MYIDKTRCYICNSEKSKFIKKENNFQIYKCLYCNLFFLNPPPDYTKGEEIIEYWSSKSERNSKINYNTYKDVNFFYLKRIIKFLNKKDKILDLGCGYGHFVNLANNNNFDAYGVDLSKNSTDFAKNNLELKNIYCNDLTNIKFEKDFFDCVIAINLFEHVHNPDEVLIEINKILKNNGIVIIRVPNMVFHEIIFKIFNFFKFFKKKDYSILADKPPVHLYGYCLKNLNYLILRNNFKIINFGPSLLGNSKKTYMLIIFYRKILNLLFSTVFMFSFKKINICPSLYIILKKMTSVKGL